MFRIHDEDNSRALDRKEFTKCMNDCRMEMTPTEVDTLFDAFDTDHDHQIDYNHFLVTIRGPINDFRKKFVKLAFDKLDSKKYGEIHMDEIKGVYNAKNHPDVKSGKKNRR